MTKSLCIDSFPYAHITLFLNILAKIKVSEEMQILYFIYDSLSTLNVIFVHLVTSVIQKLKIIREVINVFACSC